MDDRPDCYGAMFPDLDRLRHNQPVEGRALAVWVESRGIGISRRRVEVDPGGWAACTACGHYRHCYDLSVAKLLLGLALDART
jgi:hypothetical protein